MTYLEKRIAAEMRKNQRKTMNEINNFREKREKRKKTNYTDPSQRQSYLDQIAQENNNSSPLYIGGGNSLFSLYFENGNENGIIEGITGPCLYDLCCGNNSNSSGITFKDTS